MSTAPRLKAAWLTAAPTRALMAALEAAKSGGARFVGGCVRNTLRGLPVTDIDIATQLLPLDVIAACKAADIRVIETGIEHGTVTAIVAQTPFEITTLRRDVSTDGRRAVVAFTQDWREDAARRDFRLNAIYADADGTLHAPIDHSLEDARAGRVIFIGDAEMRLREDYLRILRFFRFNARYGAGIDPAGLAACAAHKDGLTQISAERIAKELFATLGADDPSEAMAAMEAFGVLGVFAPMATVGALPALIAVERAAGVEIDSVQRLMAMLPRRLRDVEKLSADLRLSNAQRDRLLAWADPGLGHVTDLGEAGLRRLAYRFGVQAVHDRALLEAADAGDATGFQTVRAALQEWKRPRLPIGGHDALAEGLAGAHVGRVLGALEDDWIASDFQMSRKALLAALKAHAHSAK